MARTTAGTGIDWGLLLLRIAVGGVLLFHGIFKVRHGVAWIGAMLRPIGLPAALANGVYVAEIVAPVLLILGLFTRVAGVLIAFDMLVAILLVQRHQIFTINRGGGWGVELEALILLTALALALTGGGRFAALRSK